MKSDQYIDIQSQDYWFKVVDFLQTNWALIDDEPFGVRLWFIGDNSGVFDTLECSSAEVAVAALLRNGFRRFADEKNMKNSLAPPRPPFRNQAHPNGPIYSSGRYWK